MCYNSVVVYNIMDLWIVRIVNHLIMSGAVMQVENKDTDARVAVSIY